MDRGYSIRLSVTVIPCHFLLRFHFTCFHAFHAVAFVCYEFTLSYSWHIWNTPELHRGLRDLKSSRHHTRAGRIDERDGNLDWTRPILQYFRDIESLSLASSRLSDYMCLCPLGLAFSYNKPYLACPIKSNHKNLLTVRRTNPSPARPRFEYLFVNNFEMASRTRFILKSMSKNAPDSCKSNGGGRENLPKRGCLRDHARCEETRTAIATI